MPGYIIHDDDVSALEFGQEHLLELGLESYAGSGDAGKPQDGYEGGRLQWPYGTPALSGLPRAERP